jgi:hypothetical protein
MHDGGKILAGLVVFFAIVTAPMWYQMAKGGESAPPDLANAAANQRCVAPTSYMRTNHMNLLDQWRDEAVREGERTYVGFDGTKYEKSLAVTCLSACHSSKQEFCDRCHEYVGAKPFCWDCHGEPRADVDPFRGRG